MSRDVGEAYQAETEALGDETKQGRNHGFKVGGVQHVVDAGVYLRGPFMMGGIERENASLIRGSGGFVPSGVHGQSP